MNATPAKSILLPVQPVDPIAPYIGGKRNLARRLCSLIEATPHDFYAEPFVGMGGVFLRRGVRPKAEAINDWSGDVANLFRCLRAHAGALNDLIALQLHSRADWDREMRVDPSTLTDLERAARFVFLQIAAFGGKVRGRNFGMEKLRRGFTSHQVGQDLLAVGRRLQGVSIEQLPWAEFLDRYDRPGVLFYLDPPYFGCERDYGDDMFRRDEFEAMADRLSRLKGRFILSLNDRPEVRQIFARFTIAGVDTHYGIAGKGNVQAREVIITASPAGADRA